MNPAHKPWKEWELEFVAKTFPDPKWKASQIGLRLNRNPLNIYRIAQRLGVKRAGYGLDHDRIVALRSEGLSLDGIATVLGCSKSGVQRVLKVQGVA